MNLYLLHCKEQGNVCVLRARNESSAFSIAQDIVEENATVILIGKDLSIERDQRVLFHSNPILDSSYIAKCFNLPKDTAPDDKFSLFTVASFNTAPHDRHVDSVYLVCAEDAISAIDMTAFVSNSDNFDIVFEAGKPIHGCPSVICGPAYQLGCFDYKNCWQKHVDTHVWIRNDGML